MTDCVVNIELRVPSSDGEDVPASGYIEFSPTKRRDLEDYIVLPDAFRVHLGDGQATVELAPTVEGDWAWRATERVRRGRRWYFAVPDGPGPVEYDDLAEVDPDTLTPTAPLPPVWKQYVDDHDAVNAVAIDAEETRATAAEAALQAAIDAVEGGDVDSVAGLSGTVSAAALKTAMSLPADTVSELADLAADLDAEAGAARNADNLTSGTVDDARIPATIARDAEVAAAVAAEAALARDASNLTSGTIADARIPATITRDSELSAALAALVNAAPGTLDTLKELADALGDDPNFATTVTTALATKATTAALSAETTARTDADKTLVRFRDTNGNTIAGKVVTITVDTVTNEIADIIVEVAP